MDRFLVTMVVRARDNHVDASGPLGYAGLLGRTGAYPSRRRVHPVRTPRAEGGAGTSRVLPPIPFRSEITQSFYSTPQR